MTMKERLRIHKEIVESNKRKLNAWKEGRRTMEYKAKLWLNKRQYLAVLDKALVIVTVDEKGNPIRWAIFEGRETA